MNLNFAENLKALRKDKAITQEKLAEVLGVTSQSISRWELNICYPDLVLLPIIANYFGVTVDSLLSNDKNSKEKDFEIFNSKIGDMFDDTTEKIDFINEYCRKYPENNYYSFQLIATIKEHLSIHRDRTERFMPLMLKHVQGLLETQYRNSAIMLIASVCSESELKKWLDMTPYSGFSRRYCLTARASVSGNMNNVFVQQGIESLEVFAKQLDRRYPDIHSAIEKCKYVFSLNEEWLEVGGELFAGIKVSKDWNYAIDREGNKHKLFNLINLSRYHMSYINDLLSNPKWAWFDSVRNTDSFRDAVAWSEMLLKEQRDKP